ncbi:MAG TPA: extracellular solute-binding protein [Pseudolabrys sp.]
MNRYLRGLATISLGALAGTLLAGLAQAQSMPELYEKAKLEKELVIYGGGPTSLYEVPARAFEQKYPGIKVTIHAGFSNVHDEKINQQLKTKTLDADLAILQTVADYIRWKNEGVLAVYKPEGWDAIDKTFKDPDGHYVGVFVTSVSYAYNRDLVKPDALPKSAMDFLKPEFRGKMIACYPHDDDITLYLFYSIVQRYGWDWMDKYIANGAQFIQGHLGVARALGSGEAMVSPDSNPNLSLREQRAGKPVDIAFSKIDPTPVWAQTAATFKDSPHPNAARLFLSWFLEKEQQSKLDTWSPRKDVAPPEGLPPLFSLKLANNYPEFISNTELVAGLRKRFEALTGPVQKKGGVR